ncbi:MAG: hypothetical protein Q4D08_07190 [Clostridia bacterium]|nr:hypothetical protein [Clostridia bacterium]
MELNPVSPIPMELLQAIDERLPRQERLLLAIDGGSASGKTTLAALLAQRYGCPVFHMDDFFLRPEQRTPQRLAEPGGNVDRERFFSEVLQPLRQGGPASYRRYDCQTGQLLPPVLRQAGQLNVIEGAYSMHPELSALYDLSVFLAVSPETQRRRILQREPAFKQQLFFQKWIPMENRYFQAFSIPERCDLRIEIG